MWARGKFVMAWLQFKHRKSVKRINHLSWHQLQRLISFTWQSINQRRRLKELFVVCLTHMAPLKMVQSDGGPASWQGFSSCVEGMEIKHKETSMYNSQSNCPSTKEWVAKIENSINWKDEADSIQISKMKNGLLQNDKWDDTQNTLPNSCECKVKHWDLIKVRHKKTWIAKKKGRVLED